MNIEEQAKATRKKYADIIDLPRPNSSRNKMTSEARAAQFAPFAALTGYHESVDETEEAVTSANELGGIVHETAQEMP